MYHLKLCKGLSYSNGKVKATKQRPDAFVEDKADADAALASGYFKLVKGPGAPSVPPAEALEDPFDRERLESMTIPELKKLAADNEVNIKGLKEKGLIIAAIIKAVASAPVPEDEALTITVDAEALAAMSDEELKALVAEKGIDLTGCETREDALERISVALLGGSYTMLDLMRE